MNQSTANKVRIIGGQWRSRLLRFPDVDGLRPTHDRVRETVFNWLAPHIVDSCCLDLFAGTGAFGFEALSRGAARATFVDSSRVLVDNLRKNAELLAATDHCAFVEAVIPNKMPVFSESFDIAFIDPPYQQGLIQSAIAALLQQNCLADNALVYIEAEKALDLTAMVGSWQCLKHKATKTLQYAVFKAVKLC